MLKEYYDFEEIKYMPIRYLMEVIAYYKPKFKAIAQRQAQKKLEAELDAKKKQRQQKQQMQRQALKRRNNGNRR